MFQDSFQHDAIRKYQMYFASLFANVYLTRSLEDGSTTARIRVPLHFAKMEHALQRVIEDPTLHRKDAIALPAMSYDLVDMRYAPERKQLSRNWTSYYDPTDANKFKVMFVPAPYDFHFRLSILVKNIDDGLKIVEQVLPYFQPDYVAKLEMMEDPPISYEVPIVLQSCAMDYDVPKDYKERVTYVWVLDFVLQGRLYGPEKKWPVIKFQDVEYFSLGISNTTFLTITTQPGLDANGQPTTDPNLTVPYLTIKATDPYDYVVTSNTSIRND